ncbi:MAG: alpha/beta hydrolase-fold protein [bacterium]
MSPVVAWLVLASLPLGAQSPGRFEVRFPASLEAKPVTGRVFVALYPRDDAEPRIAAYQSARTRVGRIPFFAVDVNQLAPGAWASVDQDAIGYPYWNIKEIPPGDYYAQAVFNVYTKYERADGHTIWAHQDQWEGQRWAFAPGNLVSTPVKVHVDPSRGIKVQLTLDHRIPPIDVAPDTRWVKRIRIQSPMLTKWWGYPQFLGATVLLPKGYDDNPTTRYPVVFAQDHFTLIAPFNFVTEDTAATPQLNLAAPGTWTAADIGRPTGGGGKRETGYEFFQQWIRDDMPRMIVVKFQHPTPFFDDSYAVNSANNGPYGDAILQELIPELEKRFRMIAKPYARVLTGGSTGGWESLALQVYHPEFFGGTWTMYPDPVDFRRYQLVDIYRDTSAFLVPNAAPGAPERMMQMSSEGQPVATMRQISQMELASGTRGRSAAQIDIWNATYGPVGADGYPRQLWDLRTGIIDRDVAHYMRDKGFDLRDYLETNWSRIGPQLVGKLHLLTGDMDDFYLGPAVYKLEEFLESTRNPYYGGSFRYGRPNKGHGWQPMTNADLLREMAAQIARNAPAGERVESWRAAP